MLPPLLGQLEESLPGDITHTGAALRLGGLVTPGAPDQANTGRRLPLFADPRPQIRPLASRVDLFQACITIGGQ